MNLKDDITMNVSAILDEEFITEDVTTAPDIIDSRLSFRNKGLQFEATVMHINMRDSTEALNKDDNSIVTKIHMCYFHIFVKIVNSLGGEVRSFNGNSMLVFFPGVTKEILSNAVKAAMQIRYVIVTNGSSVKKLFAKYTTINFGIGIDYGKVLCTNIAIDRNPNNQGLIWISNAVNKATILSDLVPNSCNIAISSFVYDHILDSVKYNIKDNKRFNMWASNYFTYNGQKESYYYTSWYWLVK